MASDLFYVVNNTLMPLPTLNILIKERRNKEVIGASGERVLEPRLDIFVLNDDEKEVLIGKVPLKEVREKVFSEHNFKLFDSVTSSSSALENDTIASQDNYCLAKNPGIVLGPPFNKLIFDNSSLNDVIIDFRSNIGFEENYYINVKSDSSIAQSLPWQSLEIQFRLRKEHVLEKGFVFRHVAKTIINVDIASFLSPISFCILKSNPSGPHIQFIESEVDTLLNKLSENHNVEVIECKNEQDIIEINNLEMSNIDVLHFIGHGSPEGLELSENCTISNRIFCDHLSRLEKKISCYVVASCYGGYLGPNQSDNLCMNLLRLKDTEYAISFNYPLRSDNARKFIDVFYSKLLFEKNIYKSYKEIIKNMETIRENLVLYGR